MAMGLCRPAPALAGAASHRAPHSATVGLERAVHGRFRSSNRNRAFPSGPKRVAAHRPVHRMGVISGSLGQTQFTGDPVNLPTTGRDLMLAVDISGSMATEDMEVDGDFVERLTVVKAVIANFAQARVGDRIGLVFFGTNAYLQAPLTFDVKSVNRLLIEAPVGIAGGKTAIGDAIGLAVKRLRMRPQDEKILILLTDGANNVGEVEPKVVVELAAGQYSYLHHRCGRR